MRQVISLLVFTFTLANSNAQNMDKGLLLRYDFNGSGIDSVTGNSTNLEGIAFADDFCDIERKSIELNSSSPKVNISVDNKHFSSKTGLTFSTWVYYKKDKSADKYFIAGQWDRKPQQRRFSLMLDKDHHVNFRVYDGKTGEPGLRSDKKLYDEVWYHVVGVYHSDERQQIFINGELHGQGIQKGSGINPIVDQPMVLGKRRVNDSTFNYYKGRLDKVRLYNRALSLHEVHQLYHHEKKDECIVQYTIEASVSDLLTNDGVSANIHLNHVGKNENHPFSFGWDGKFKFKTEANSTYSVKLIAENYFEYIDTIGPFNKNSWVNLKMKPIELERVFTIKNLHFKQGSAQVLPTSYPSLDKLVQMMIDNENLEIELRGHTDNIGDSALNQVLSEQRVDEVKSYITKKGVKDTRVTTVGYGGSKPLSTKMDPRTRRMNRRVEFVVTKY